MRVENKIKPAVELVPGRLYKNYFGEIYLAVKIGADEYRLCSVDNGNCYDDESAMGGDYWYDVTDQYELREI